MRSLLQDLRYATRMLIQRPGVTILALLTLALGIGLNTAMYSVVHGMGSRGQRLRNPESLVLFWGTSADEPAHSHIAVGAIDFLDWRAQAQSFADMAVYSESGGILSGSGDPVRARVLSTTSNLMPMIGVEARLGRLPRMDEEQAGAEGVIVLTDRLWRSRYGGDPDILGRTVTLDDRPHTVIGVLFPRAESYELWYDTDVVVPLAIDPARISRGSRPYRAVGRLRPGVTVAQAQAEIDAIAARLSETFPETNSKTGVWLQPAEEFFRPVEHRLMEVVLLAAVGAILTIACVNLANLLLARATVRGREFAIRAALGASRGRLVRQMLTESGLLALLGSGLGLLAGTWTLDAAATLMPDFPLSREELRLNPAVLGYALLVAIGAALVFGLAPALTASRVSASESMKEGSGTGSASRSRNRVGSGLVVAQLGLAVPLLVCCGLVTKHLVQLRSVDLGFDANRVLTMRIDLPKHRYAEKPRQTAFVDESLQRIRAVPAVEMAGASSSLPFAGFGWSSTDVIVEGRTEPDLVGFEVITPGYLEVLQIPLLAGRRFTDLDQADGQRVAIVNQKMAETYWPQQEALGKQIHLGDKLGQGDTATVVGVVGDYFHPGLGGAQRQAQMYFPYEQNPSRGLVVVARTTADPQSVVSAVHGAIHAVDPGLPVYDTRTAAQAIARWLRDDHLAAGFTGALALLALTLASIGLFGVMSYSVAQRRHEIGVRVALGAIRRDIIRLVLRRCLYLAAIGAAIGLVVSVPVGMLVASNLYAVHGTDPLTLTLVVGVLLLVGLLAGYVPARRATKVDPMVALRCE